jgi:hypothetical protein
VLRRLAGLQLVEQGVEALEPALPEPAVVFEPFGGFRERPCLEPPRPSLRVAAAGDQAGAFQHLEVLRDGGLAHREGLGQLRHRRIAGGKPREDGPPRGVGERRERGVEPICALAITVGFHK